MGHPVPLSAASTITTALCCSPENSSMISGYLWCEGLAENVTIHQQGGSAQNNPIPTPNSTSTTPAWLMAIDNDSTTTAAFRSC